jgi:UDP-N-acetylglucosamine 1-carboxyvinyltransferase
MDMLVIEGGRALNGDVIISGSKNSSLPILIASLLCEKPSTIRNVPDLADTRFLLDLLKTFGVKLSFLDHVAHIDCSKITGHFAHYDMVRKMRASVLVLAPLLARTGQATVSLPGGCAIGTRPVDIHLEGLAKLGAIIEVKDGYIHAHLKDGQFVGAEYKLPLPSVGASENLIMAAVLAKGSTKLKGVAQEPEVYELCQALNKAGARIFGLGTSELIIEGVTSLSSIEHDIQPDRVEAGTFMALAALTKSEITLKNVKKADLENVMERFIHAGVKFSDRLHDNGLCDLKLSAPLRLLATDIETAAFPGFPTDMQAQFMAAMTLAEGTSMIHERIFENRMMHVPELKRMGADITVKNGLAKVVGQKSLFGAPVMATDLRASASLIIAALAAQGKSEIRRVYHLDRGYEALEKKLTLIGANIKRVEQSL